MHNGFLDKRRRHLSLREVQIENVLPEHFAQNYPKFISLLSRYYEWQNQNDPNELLNHLFATRDINETDITLLSFIEDEFLLGEAYFEGFGDTEAEKRAAANFSNHLFRSKGTKFAIEWFFRSFYGLNAEVSYPKENVFTLNNRSSQIGPDSLRFLTNNELYQTFSLLIRVGVPISQWRDIFKLFAHPAGMYLGAEVTVNDAITSILSDSADVSQRLSESYTILANPDSADEGTLINFTVTGNNVLNNLGYVYYHVEDVTTNDSDFGQVVPRLNSLQYLSIDDSEGTAIGRFTIKTRRDEVEGEAPETFNVIIRDDDLRILGTETVTINDLTSSYVMTPTALTVPEDTPVTFNITGTNVPNDGETTLYYYVNHITTDDADFLTAPPSISNPAPVSITSSIGAFTLTPKIDNDLTDNGERFEVILQTLDGIEKDTATITLSNVTPPFSIGAIGTIFEGANINAPLTISSQDFGDTLNWSISGASATDPRIPTKSGSFVAASASQVLTIPTVSNDSHIGSITGTLTVTNANYTPSLSVNNTFTVIDSAAEYAIMMNPITASEGDTVVFDISGRNIQDGEYYYYIDDITTEGLDFSGGRPEDASREAVTITDNSGTTNSVTFAIRGAIADKTFITYLYDDPAAGSGTLLTSGQFTIAASEYSLTANRTSVNEGGTVTFTFTGPDGTYYWWLLGNSGLFTQGDVVGEFPTFNNRIATFEVVGGTGSFDVEFVQDLRFEGPETFTAIVSAGENTAAIAESQVITINDTSKQEYTLSAPNIVEGSNLVVDVSHNRGPSEVLFYEITGAAAARFSSTQISELYTGPAAAISSFTVDLGASSATNTYEGGVTGTVTVSRGGYASSGGTVLSSDTFNIIDANATYSLVASTTNPDEGDPITWSVGGTNIPNGTYYYRITSIIPKATTSTTSSGTSLINLTDTTGIIVGMSCDNAAVPGRVTFVGTNQVTMEENVTSSIPSGTVLHFGLDAGSGTPLGAASVFDDIASGYRGSVSVTSNSGGFVTVTAENADTVDDSYTMGLYTSETSTTPVASVSFVINDATVASSPVDIVMPATTIRDIRDNYATAIARVTFTSGGQILGTGNLNPGGNNVLMGTWTPSTPLGNYTITATGPSGEFFLASGDATFSGSLVTPLSLSSDRQWALLINPPGPPAVGTYFGSENVVFTITDTADPTNTDSVTITFIVQTEGDDENQCFVFNSLVTLEDGSRVQIADIKVGDRVRGSDGFINQVTENRHMYREDTMYGWGKVDPFVTGSHPFLTTDGWKSFDAEAGQKMHPELGITQLSEGDHIVTWDGSEYGTSEVKAITAEIQTVAINRLSVTGNDTYIVNGFVVHNK